MAKALSDLAFPNGATPKMKGVKGEGYHDEPIWKGPEVDGISQSMIARYLSCKERFRISYIEGIQPIPTFRAPIEFGNMWHEAEETFAKYGTASVDQTPKWQRAVYDYCNKMAESFPMQKDQIIHWMKVTIALFPVYVGYWKKHPDVEARKPLLEEQIFSISYTLPSGRSVLLRGKWDSVDIVTTDIWFQENKTKSTIDKAKTERQLMFDLQTMLYTTALTLDTGIEILENAKREKKIKGVRYNVIRRSTHKTDESMMKKVMEDIAAGRGDEWLCRWNMEIPPEAIGRFRRWALDPILENMLDDYEWWCDCYAANRKDMLFDYRERSSLFPHHQARHFVMPYMGYNPLSEGGESDTDRYLFSGNDIGLHSVTRDDLFVELKE